MTNRELAKTALAIYAKHSVPQNTSRSNCAVTSLNENVNYNRNPRNIKEAISNLLLEYSSDVVLLSEQSIGRKLNSNEINNVAGRLLEYINILPPKQQVSMMQELTTLYEGDYFQTPTDDSGDYSTDADQYLDSYDPHALYQLAAGGNNVYNTASGRNRRPLAQQNQGQFSAGNPTNTRQYPYPISMDDGLRPGKPQAGFGPGNPTNTAANQYIDPYGPYQNAGFANAGNPTDTGQYPYPISQDDGLRPGKPQAGSAAFGNPVQGIVRTGGPQTDAYQGTQMFPGNPDASGPRVADTARVIAGDGRRQGVPTRAGTQANRKKRR